MQWVGKSTWAGQTARAFQGLLWYGHGDVLTGLGQPHRFKRAICGGPKPWGLSSP